MFCTSGLCQGMEQTHIRSRALCRNTQSCHPSTRQDGQPQPAVQGGIMHRRYARDALNKPSIRCLEIACQASAQTQTGRQSSLAGVDSCWLMFGPPESCPSTHPQCPASAKAFQILIQLTARGGGLPPAAPAKDHRAQAPPSGLSLSSTLHLIHPPSSLPVLILSQAKLSNHNLRTYRLFLHTLYEISPSSLETPQRTAEMADQSVIRITKVGSWHPSAQRGVEERTA